MFARSSFDWKSGRCRPREDAEEQAADEQFAGQGDRQVSGWLARALAGDEADQ
jgi:hypothetical protein